MKTLLKILLLLSAVAIMFIAYNLLHTSTSDFIVFPFMVLSIAFAVFSDPLSDLFDRLFRRRLTHIAANRIENFRIPRLPSSRKQLANELISQIDSYVKIASNTCSIELFIHYYDSFLADLQKLELLADKVTIPGEPPSLAHSRLSDEFQWHLCDAIERHKNECLNNIRGKYRNSVEFQQKEALSFKNALDRVSIRFSEKTLEFADKSLDEVNRASGLTMQLDSPASPSVISSSSLSTVDRMNGHAFEYWCADLLRKNGFTNVSVTQGSGDQGVDVLARKDDIKYAVQCKCYSSDLGNTPIQEVHAGKAFYGCQVGAVMTNRYFTKGAQELAAKTGVLLWDRAKLSEMLNNAE